MNGKIRLAIALGALVALAAVVAYGDYNVMDKTTHYANATSGMRTNSVGVLLSDDYSRDRDRVISYDNVLGDTIGVGFADSTILLDVHDAARGFLYIRVTEFTGAVAATPFVRLAIRIKGCLNTASDTTSVYNWAPRSEGPAVDASDSLTYGGVTLPSALAASNTEIIVTIPADGAAASKWARNNSIMVPLRDASGAWFWSENMQIVVRPLSASVASPRIFVSYRGVSL